MGSPDKKCEKDMKDFEEKLKKLECPFNWDMDDIDETISTDYKPHDEEDFIPLLKFMRIIMRIYVKTNGEEEFDDILSEFKKCEEVIATLKEQADSQFSTDAVLHILQATKCYVYWKFDKADQAQEILAEIKSYDSSDKLERSTINACRSIGWSKYHNLGTQEAIEFIRRALLDNPSSELWNFILGKNLRRIRRDLSVGSIPTDEEKNAFLNAYEKSKNPVYGIFVAQMYREMRNNQKAIHMYEQILRSKPKSHTIYLRLALGFIQLWKMPLAKMCLDEVAVKYPEDCMYLHYRGHYYRKSKKYKEAIYYLKKAADMDNFPAAREYLRCMMQVDPAYNVSEYLLKLIEKFKDLPENQIQTLLIDTAYSYWRTNDVKKALKYFVLSIEIDPASQALTEWYSFFESGKAQNVYGILSKDIFPVVKNKEDSLDENTLDNYHQLQSYYDDYLKNEIESTQKALSKIRTH